MKHPRDFDEFALSSAELNMQQHAWLSIFSAAMATSEISAEEAKAIANSSFLVALENLYSLRTR